MAKTYLRAYNREIESMLDGGLFQEAVAHSLHILKTHPKHLETYRLLGKAYLELKQYSSAVDIFTRLLASVPNDFVANVGMGIIRDEENKLDDAIWHMERAFESQPSNPAIQSELQRLYARRDGSAPPRIRMTRGALAHMYLQGELYPQAISEIKGILSEDPGRTDMQVLLARAHFRSGQKTEAAEVASSVLRRYPNSLEANRVLAEIFGVDRPENAMPYRQRVYELDPYAAHTNGSLFQTDTAPESAVALEKLDWNGQPVGMASDWQESRGIGLPSQSGDEQPAWLQSGLDKEDTVPPAPFSDPGTTRAVAAPGSDDQIPDFLRKAGWGESTGGIDESKSSFGEDESQTQAIAAGELPDWVKQMAPSQQESPAGEKEDMPDWMNRIDPGVLDATTAAASPTSDEPDWLKGLGEPSYNAPAELSAAAEDQPDWLKGIGEAAPAASSEPLEEDQPDWLKEQSIKPEDQKSPAIDFSSPQAGVQTPPPATEKDMDDTFAWLEGLAAKQGATEGLLTKPEDRLEEEPDWVRQAKSLTGELDQDSEQGPSATETPSSLEPGTPSANLELSRTTGEEKDDSFAWLEGLAAKQGATEGLLTKPEDRMEQEPDWVKRAKEAGEDEKPPAAKEAPAAEGMDTAMWLRSLDQEVSAGEPAAESTSDETALWLKGLDETSKPEPAAEPRGQDTSMWLRGLEETDAKPEPTPDSADETAMWLKSLDEVEAQPKSIASAADLPDWMQDVDEEAKGDESIAERAAPEQARAETSPGTVDEGSISPVSVEGPESGDVPRVDTGNLPSWLRGIDQSDAQAAAQEDLPAWLRDDTGEVMAEPEKIEPTRAEEWQPVEEQPAPAPSEKLEPARTKKVPPAKKEEAQPKPYREPATRKAAGVLTADEDPILSAARNELSRSNIPGALETYSKLIKRGRYLDEVIFDLREALYRYPVEVSIWQSLGDAYMRGNRLQDALDAYTKAEELLR